MAHEKPHSLPRKLIGRLRRHPGWTAAGLYTFIAMVLTWPLIVRMNSSVYGFYDHISTDLFAAIHYYFWYLKYSIIEMHSSPLFTTLTGAPYGSRVFLINMTGYLFLPVTALFGHLFSYNSVILLNLILSGAGMYLLVRHLTGNAAAGFVAGIIFAFCPNMMVRSYTTFDSTQVQWLPLYTLFIIRFIERRTWKNAALITLFLVCVILFSMPYFLVYLPVHTLAIVLVYAGWRVWGDKRGFSGLWRDVTGREALKAWGKLAAGLAVALTVFGVYFTFIVGSTTYTSTVQRTTEQLEELSLAPTDYLMPHPRSALLGGSIKQSYWDAVRPGKDPDSFVAYIGYIALVLAVLGFVKRFGGAYRWVLLVTGLAAFISTLGPTVFGVPTPSGLIHQLYAPFARRILIYKVFVQMAVAGLAGGGVAYLIERVKGRNAVVYITVVLSVLLLAEYTLVPPVLSVDLTENPEIYERVRDLPDDAKLIEVPVRRNNGNLFQGYAYYQTVHTHPLFNTFWGLPSIPEEARPFYEQMDVPLEAQAWCNLATLNWLGISHLTYHWYIGTTTVRFGSWGAPKLARGEGIDGLDQVFSSDRRPDVGPYASPFDYTFADLYEITAEPSPVALTFDYASPYNRVPGMLRQERVIPFGWGSALIDTTATFYYPLADGDGRLVRLLRQGGEITCSNLSDEPVAFRVSFNAESPDDGRELVAKWQTGDTGGDVVRRNEDTVTVISTGDQAVAGEFTTGPEPVECETSILRLEPHSRGVLSLWSTKDAFQYEFTYSEGTVRLPVTAVLTGFRVLVEHDLPAVDR